ncbi:MAG TPA: WD40 repeat domain-containing protein [Candidatus Kapabacteria bacterium]|nr:WD40 repeat domain-containing protein [Candidatus Kapabacteria bacterium]
MLSKKALLIMFNRITPIALLVLLQPLVANGQATDSLHLLWRNEAISGVTAHAFSHSGKILALVNDHEIRFWDLNSSRFVRTIVAPSHNYSGLAFTPGDSELVLTTTAIPTHPFGIYPMRRLEVARMILHYHLATSQWDSVTPALQPSDKWALAPDGLSIAVLTDSGIVSDHDTRSFEVEVSRALPKDTMYHPYGPPCGIFFGAREIIVYWRDSYEFLDSHSLDSMGAIDGYFPGYLPSFPPGDGIFIPYGTLPYVYSSRTGLPSALQPPKLKDEHGFEMIPISAVLLNKERTLVSRYQIWAAFGDGGGPPVGEDTLVVTSLDRPTWGIRVPAALRIIGIVPNRPSILLLGDGRRFTTLDTKR